MNRVAVNVKYEVTEIYNKDVSDKAQDFVKSLGFRPKDVLEFKYDSTNGLTIKTVVVGQ